MRMRFLFGNIKLLNPESVRGRLRECPLTEIIKNRVFMGVEMEFGDGGRRWCCPLTRVSFLLSRLDVDLQTRIWLVQLA